jgi:hypothetical protein
MKEEAAEGNTAAGRPARGSGDTSAFVDHFWQLAAANLNDFAAPTLAVPSKGLWRQHQHGQMSGLT